MSKYKMFMHDDEIKNLFKNTNNPFHYYFLTEVHGATENFDKKREKYIEGEIKRREHYYPLKFLNSEKKINWNR